MTKTKRNQKSKGFNNNNTGNNNSSKVRPLPTSTYTDDSSREFVDQTYHNKKTNLIEITQDKLENILMKHLSNLEIKGSWVAPLTTSITCFLAIITSDFKDALLLNGDTWKAVFIVLGIFSIGWLIINTTKIYKCRKRTTVDFLIETIKNAHQS
ncbi:MAG: hypothetical protein LBN24_03130 [Mediterranea sp.]|jgi:hypothetical protein|nr:hypothetical protein [Mediterranea sp.]